MKREVLFSTKPQPSYHSFHSLALNLFSSAILVDYAAHGSDTPTPWPKRVAASLSGTEAEALDIIRGILAHGWVLRDYAIRTLPPDHPAHLNWDSLKGWLENLSDDEIIDLTIAGIQSGLSFYDAYLDEMAQVEFFLQKLGTGMPEKETLADPENRRNALLALLHSWQAGEPEDTADKLMTPHVFRKNILIYTTVLWEKGLKEAWHIHEKGHHEAVRYVSQLTAIPLSVDDFIMRVTGLKPEEKAFDVLHEARHITFVPCVHLGQFLSVFKIEKNCYVLFDPEIQQQKTAHSAYNLMPHHLPEGTEENMAALLEAIGDKTRLKILLKLKKQPGLHTIQLAEALNIHQSTVSRHCQLLQKNGVITVTKTQSYKCFSLNKERTNELTDWLLRNLG